jgi:prepilin-type processing-associated H-X9-DG protein
VIVRSGCFPTCPRRPYSDRRSSSSEACNQFHFWSPPIRGANFALADGSVRFFPYSASPLMPAWATRSGGESVTLPDEF